MNGVGDVTSVKGTSMNLNSQPGQGCAKPSPSAGTANPGGHKPTRPAAAPVSLNAKGK
jgi:hypothetical protein